MLSIESETIVAIILELACKHLFYFLEILFLGFHNALAKHAIKELLPHFGILVNKNLFHLKVEVALDVGSLVLVDIEHSGKLSNVATGTLTGIEHEFITHFLTYKFSLLVIVLEILGRHDSALHLDTILLSSAILGKFYHRATQQGILVGNLASHLRTKALLERIVLVINHFLANLNVVVRHLNSLVELEFKLRSKAQVKLKREVLLVNHVDLSVGRQHGLAKQIDIVLANIIG